MSSPHPHHRQHRPAPAAALPQLGVRTTVVDDDVTLASLLGGDLTGAWLHDGEGLVAVGSCLRLETSGADRFAEAGSAFAALADRARVVDDVSVPGSGLVALGSFSYAADSARPSQLIIPAAVLGVREGRAFCTVITAGDEVPQPGRWRELFSPTPRVTPVVAPEADLDLEPAHTPDEYQGLVAQAVARIRAGEAHKVVLSERAEVTCEADVDSAALTARLAERYPTTWVYRVADVIGASPEMLARTTGAGGPAQGGQVFSRVLAGTRPVAEDTQLDAAERASFLADPKERSEHAYAVDSVTERLATVAQDVHASPEPFVLRLPGIEHLASDVRAHLRPGVTSLDAAAALHPSAAVSGTPRAEADAMIAELEGADRGGYAAPVGWMDARGNGEWAIALRMAHVLGPRRLRVHAGGGLVAASDPVTEHAEVLAKTRPVLSALRALGR